MPWANITDIVRLYVFDRELRLICTDAIERLEVAIRCRMIYEFSTRYGTNWYEDANLYHTGFQQTSTKVYQELARTGEVFIKHYKSKYTQPANPPAWMTIEILSFGQLSRMYKNLKAR